MDDHRRQRHRALAGFRLGGPDLVERIRPLAHMRSPRLRSMSDQLQAAQLAERKPVKIASTGADASDAHCRVVATPAMMVRISSGGRDADADLELALAAPSTRASRPRRAVFEDRSERTTFWSQGHALARRRGGAERGDDRAHQRRRIASAPGGLRSRAAGTVNCESFMRADRRRDVAI